jgi:hypothetical protein
VRLSLLLLAYIVRRSYRLFVCSVLHAPKRFMRQDRRCAEIFFSLPSRLLLARLVFVLFFFAHLIVTSGNFCIALRRSSVVKWVYWRLTAALSWPTISRASTSDTPAAFNIVTALCLSE